NNEQYEENVRLHNAGEEFLARRELESFAVRLAQNELRLAAVESCNFAAVQLAQKVIGRTSNEVDEIAVERFFLGKRSRLGNRGLRQLWVAAAFPRIAAKECHGIVVDLLSQRFVDLRNITAHSKNGGCRAGVRTGRHGGDVRGEQNVEARRGCPRASG